MGRNPDRKPRGLLVVLLLLALSARLSAQTGGPYDLTRNTIDGGGATFSTGGVYRLGGTVGQPDAGAANGGVFSLRGGFWPVVLPAPTATPSATPSHTATLTRTPAPSSTATPSATHTRIATATQTMPSIPTATGTTPPALTASSTPTRTPTTTATLPQTATESPTPVASATTTPTALTPAVPTTTPTATPTSTSSPPLTVTPTPTTTVCAGDCGHDGEVSIGDVVLMVNVALEQAEISECDAGDRDQNDVITIDEILVAVYHALNGCG